MTDATHSVGAEDSRATDDPRFPPTPGMEIALSKVGWGIDASEQKKRPSELTLHPEAPCDPTTAQRLVAYVRNLLEAWQDEVRADNGAADKGEPSSYSATETAEAFFETLNDLAKIMGVDVEPEQTDDETADDDEEAA